jgi:hypothetical protein
MMLHAQARGFYLVQKSGDCGHYPQFDCDAALPANIALAVIQTPSRASRAARIAVSRCDRAPVTGHSSQSQ